MKDIQEVITRKQAQRDRLAKEIAALESVLPLLADDPVPNPLGNVGINSSVPSGVTLAEAIKRWP
jgi:hypothetical protein